MAKKSDDQGEIINSTSAKRFTGELLASWQRTWEIREASRIKIEPELADESEARVGLYAAAEKAGLPLIALKLEVARRKDEIAAARANAKREAKAGSEIADQAHAIREVLGDFAGTGLGSAAVKAAGKKEKGATVTNLADRRGKANPDMSAESKAAALNVGDEPDIRSTQQKEKEAARKEKEAEVAAGPLKGIKALGDQPPATH
jgi:hypothetical protein